MKVIKCWFLDGIAPYAVKMDATLYEGEEVLKEYGCKRYIVYGRFKYHKYDNFDEWTLDGSTGELKFNPFSKPHKKTVVCGKGWYFVG